MQERVFPFRTTNVTTHTKKRGFDIKAPAHKSLLSVTHKRAKQHKVVLIPYLFHMEGI